MLYYTPSDVNRNMNILGVDNKAEAKRRKKDLNQMKSYVDSGDCRWKHIEAYFGEKPGCDCGCCDNCKGQRS